MYSPVLWKFDVLWHDGQSYTVPSLISLLKRWFQKCHSIQSTAQWLQEYNIQESLLQLTTWFGINHIHIYAVISATFVYCKSLIIWQYLPSLYFVIFLILIYSISYFNLVKGTRNHDKCTLYIKLGCNQNFCNSQGFKFAKYVIQK